jgi:hypothetical protein
MQRRRTKTSLQLQSESSGDAHWHPPLSSAAEGESRLEHPSSGVAALTPQRRREGGAGAAADAAATDFRTGTVSAGAGEGCEDTNSQLPSGVAPVCGCGPLFGCHCAAHANEGDRCAARAAQLCGNATQRCRATGTAAAAEREIVATWFNVRHPRRLLWVSLDSNPTAARDRRCPSVLWRRQHRTSGEGSH